jgi:hypothetical protein
MTDSTSLEFFELMFHALKLITHSIDPPDEDDDATFASRDRRAWMLAVGDVAHAWEVLTAAEQEKWLAAHDDERAAALRRVLLLIRMLHGAATEEDDDGDD